MKLGSRALPSSIELTPTRPNGGHIQNAPKEYYAKFKARGAG